MLRILRTRAAVGGAEPRGSHDDWASHCALSLAAFDARRFTSPCEIQYEAQLWRRPPESSKLPTASAKEYLNRSVVFLAERYARSPGRTLGGMLLMGPDWLEVAKRLECRAWTDFIVCLRAWRDRLQ